MRNLNNMFCSNCGEKNNEKAIFCKSCGLKLFKNMNYAGFWLRFGAYFIDFLGLLFLAVILGIIGFGDAISSLGYFSDYIFWVIYSTFFLSLFSNTPGKKIYGLEVITEDKDKLSFKNALIRSLLQPLSLFFFGSGYYNMDQHDLKQAWHDKKAHTIVIVKNKKDNYMLQIILSIIGLALYAYFWTTSRTN